MNITYNGMTNPSNTISFTGFPNILEISEDNSGTYAMARITISDLNSVNDGNEYTLEINGQKLISTSNLNNAYGNKFYLSSSNFDKNIVAYRLVDNLRSLPTLPINYYIMIETDNDGLLIPSIIITAKEAGSQYNLEVKGTLIDKRIAKVVLTSGSSSSTLSSNYSKLKVDIYKVENANTDKIGTETFNKGKYLTTLTKEVSGNNNYFDLSPILSTVAEHGKINELNLFIYHLTGNSVELIQRFADLYVVPGYSVNQGYPYLNTFDKLYLAQNVGRGTTKGVLNNTILYIYEPTVPLSLYATAKASSTVIKINYVNSARVMFATETVTVPVPLSLNNFSLNLNKNNFGKSTFVDIDIQEVGTLRYNVIKPLKATDEIQRIYFTNSYGGTSFFDFTGERTEQRKTKVEYYQKNLFDYYSEDTVQLNKVYDKNITITVTLTSHNIEKDGTWIFFDMQNSTNAWTFVNNKKYFITITDLKISESTVNGIYTASVEYEYSMADTY